MISSSFLMLHVNRSTTVPAHRPHLGLIPGISRSESMHESLRCSPIIQKQYKLAKRWDIKYSDRERGDHSLSCTTAKGIINYLVTERQIGDSQPFPPLESITMYPVCKSATTRRQQTGDEAENKRNTVVRGEPHGDDNSICVDHLIFVY